MAIGGLLFSMLLVADVPPVRPNVLILMADDLRADALAALGNSDARTPNLDRLVQRGTQFRCAYGLGSNQPAVCLPSRNMFLSGRAYFRWKGQPHAPADGPNLPRSFRESGYETFHVSKRGNVAVEIEKVFEHRFYLQDEHERRSGEPGKTVVDHAIDDLAHRDRSRPFLMYLAFEAPHDPRVANPSYRDPRPPRELSLPANFLPEHPFDNGELRVRDELLASFPRTPDEVRQHWADYHAVITGLDHHIGRLITYLEQAGLSEQTLIVITSDNGLAMGSHGLMGKQNLYEHSVRVPLILTGPGIKPATSDGLVYLLDVFPSLCEFCGLPVRDSINGRSFVPILKDPTKPGRPDLLFCYRDLQRALRTPDWKLIHYPKVGRTQLFHVAQDPDERFDRSADADLAPLKQDLFRRLAERQKEWGDDLPLALP